MEVTGDMNVRQRENVRGLRMQVYVLRSSVREKDREKERDMDGGCHRIPRIYERKQDTRNRMAAGGHVKVREMPGRKNQRVRRKGKMRKRDRGNAGESLVKKRTYTYSELRRREGRTREWSEIVQLSASERKRVGAMCVGHVERACVLGSPVCLSLSLCLPPFSTIHSPCLSANVILQLSLSYSRSNRGASIPRPRIPCTPHRSQEGSLRSQPTRKQADTPL